MAKYYRVAGPYTHSEVDKLFTEKERGLDGICSATKTQHRWLIYPWWSTSVREGGKEYVVCLDCNEHSHL